MDDNIDIFTVKRNAIWDWADEYDQLSKAVYGKNYTFSSAQAFHSLGKKTSVVCACMKGKLVAIMMFVHEEENDTMELGRFMKHPDTPFHAITMMPEMREVFAGLLEDPYLLIFGRSRLWVTSEILEYAGLQITGSWITPFSVTSQWGKGKAHHYIGLYFLPQAGRIQKTMAITTSLSKLLPKWRPIFQQHSFGIEPFEGLMDRLEDIEEGKFIHRIDNDIIHQGEYANIPCLPDKEIIEKIEHLLREGYVCMGMYPSWKKIQLDGKLDEVYINYLVLEKKLSGFTSYPISFPLSELHYQFTKEYLCDDNQNHLYYGFPMDKLFRIRTYSYEQKNFLETEQSKLLQNQS
ncbi:MAG: hypothetical protein ACFFD4_05285 [Candidatus Odinarchaeota archaeon]